MKIVLISSSLGAGGAERGLVVTAKAFYDKGHDVTVITYNDEIPDAYTLAAGITREHITPGYPTKDIISLIKLILAMRSKLRELKADAYLSFILDTNVFTLLSAIGLNLPIHIWNQNDYFNEPKPKYLKFLSRILFPKAKTIAFLDKGLAEDCNRKFPHWKALGIPNPVTELVFKQNKYQLNCKFNIAAMGRLAPQKAFDQLIIMFSEICNSRSEWGLVIIGEGDLREPLQHQINELNLQDRITLIGNQFPPFDLLQQCDIFAFSSIFEGQGMALIEAMACGIPAVSFNCPTGPSQIIDHEKNGYLIKPGDFSSFKSFLSKLMQDPELRTKISDEGKKIINNYTPDSISQKWLELFQK